MNNLFVPFTLAKQLIEKGFDLPCIAWYDPKTEKFNMLGQGDHNMSDYIHTSFHTKEIIESPLYCQVVDWFREKYKIDITIMPVFREKCGYDSFKRDGYTFEIMKIEPCTYLIWGDYNVCGEDRDDPENRDLLKPSFKNYYDCYNKAIEIALELIKV